MFRTTLRTAEPLGVVTPEAFQTLDEFAREHGVVYSQTTRLDFALEPQGHPKQDIFAAEAADAIGPFMEATGDWILKDAGRILFSYTQGLVLPGKSLRTPGWHLHSCSSTRSMERTAVFSDRDSTLAAVGTLRGTLRRQFELAVTNPVVDDDHRLDRITKLALANGVLQAIPASKPYQGAGLTENTLHTSPPNNEPTPIERSLLRILSFVR